MALGVWTVRTASSSARRVETSGYPAANCRSSAALAGSPSCPNASAALFTSAKISQFALLPQGHPERERRVLKMVQQMDLEAFGNCSNHGECEAVCPKEISIGNIARMRREYMRALAKLKGKAPA